MYPVKMNSPGSQYGLPSFCCCGLLWLRTGVLFMIDRVENCPAASMVNSNADARSSLQNCVGDTKRVSMQRV